MGTDSTTCVSTASNFTCDTYVCSDTNVVNACNVCEEDTNGNITLLKDTVALDNMIDNLESQIDCQERKLNQLLDCKIDHLESEKRALNNTKYELRGLDQVESNELRAQRYQLKNLEREIIRCEEEVTSKQTQLDMSKRKLEEKKEIYCVLMTNISVLAKNVASAKGDILTEIKANIAAIEAIDAGCDDRFGS